jgi:hypothetical protein
MKNVSVLFIIFLGLMFNSCKKEVGPAGPDHTGNIIGFVTLYNSNGEKLNNGEGVEVSIDGNNPISVNTDSIGKYQLDNIKTGVYDLTFSKDSFSSYKRIGLQFIGGTDPVVSNASLYVSSKNVISNLTLAVVNSQVRAYGNIGHTGYYGYYRYYIGLDASVSNTNYYSTGTLSLLGTTFNAFINTDLYSSGSSIYILIYGITSGDAGYQDITTGDIIYPSLNTVGSNVASIIVP